MSFNTPKSSPNLNENLDNIKLSDAFSKLELNFAETYKISLEGLKVLQELLKKKSSIELSELKFEIQASNLDKTDKATLDQIPDNSFQEFAHQIFSLRETISQQKSALKESIVGGEQKDFISSKKPNGISDARYARACNPSKPHHHLDSCIVGVYQLAYSTAKLGGGIVIDLGRALTIDGYNLITGKAKLPNYNI